MLERLTAPRADMGLVFLPVDVPAQAKRHRLAERAREDGARGLPDAITDEWSLAEQEVTGGISVERERCASEVASHLRAQRDALAQLQTSMDVARLRQSADHAVTRLGEIRALWSGEVADLRRRAVGQAAEVEEFKRARGLTREPRLPKDRGMSKALLVLFWVAESTVNALFFAAGSDLGYLGGAMLAFCLSAVNVGLGAISGAVFLRRANSNRVMEGLAAGAMFVAAECALILFNGFVAHYRDLYAVSGDATDVHRALFVENSVQNFPDSGGKQRPIVSTLVHAIIRLFGRSIWGVAYGLNCRDPASSFGEQGEHQFDCA